MFQQFVLKFQGWQMVYKVQNILDTTQQKRDSKILKFHGSSFVPVYTGMENIRSVDSK